MIDDNTFQELVRLFNFHHYDNLKHTAKKLDPRVRPSDAEGEHVTTLLFGSFNGDLTALRRYSIQYVCACIP